jgi:hypothetical protein
VKVGAMHGTEGRANAVIIQEWQGTRNFKTCISKSCSSHLALSQSTSVRQIPILTSYFLLGFSKGFSNDSLYAFFVAFALIDCQILRNILPSLSLLS